MSRCEIATREYCLFMHGYFHEDATLCSQVLCIIVLFVSVDFSVLTYSLIYILVLCRSTVWMMCVACCLSLTLMFQISFTASGSPSSSMLGMHKHPVTTKTLQVNLRVSLNRVSLLNSANEPFHLGN